MLPSKKITTGDRGGVKWGKGEDNMLTHCEMIYRLATHSRQSVSYLQILS